MEKKSFDDIVPPKRSIRNINNSHTHLSRNVDNYDNSFEHDKRYNNNMRRPLSSRFAIWFITIIILIVLFISFSFFFSGAKIIIIPKQNNVVVGTQFSAAINADVGELSYETMTIEKTGSKKVVATDTEEVKEKASGRIVIFNNFDSSNQRLIKNTRFETPEGLIYRINKSVVVPGQKIQNGEKISGSIEVTVYADEVGEKYNIGLTDFTIPGFKDSPRFEGFYARSKTEMTGGFFGKKLIANPDDMKTAKDELHTELKQQLMNEAFSQKPDGFYLFEDMLFIEFESEPSVDNGNEIEIIEKATLYGILFNKKEFAGHIAEKRVSDDESVEISDINTLKILVTDKENFRPWEDEEFEFTVNGNAHIVWTFDEDKLKDDLSGKAKSALTTVLSGYPSIDEAEVVLTPFWKRSFPNDTDKIKIENKLN